MTLEMQYGASARVLDPPWLAEQIAQTLKEAYTNYIQIYS